MAKESVHTRAAHLAADDMKKLMDSFGQDQFMSDSASPKTEARRALFDAMASDLKQMLASGMPMSVVERLARADKES